MNFENLWAPWRMVYLRELTRKAETLGDAEPGAGPFLSEYFKHPQQDEANHVVYRNEFGMLVLNLYPYACGHLLAALGNPRPTLLDYEPPQRAEFWKLVELGADLIERTFHPQGINMGINQGLAAGAGLPDHLHAHLVPRWNADTNFITVVGQIRIVPDSLESVARQYQDTMKAMAES
jgi:ATP adenylyltransferase